MLRDLARQTRTIMQYDPIHNCVRVDWREHVMVFRPSIRKDKMQSLGLTQPQINNAIQATTSGYTIGTFRDGDRSFPILLNLIQEERYRIENITSYPIWSSASGASVPLGTVISGLDVYFEGNILLRRNRRQVISVASDVTLCSAPLQKTYKKL